MSGDIKEHRDIHRELQAALEWISLLAVAQMLPKGQPPICRVAEGFVSGRANA